MGELNVKHFLEIYQNRLTMQKEGITNPSQDIRELTQLIVNNLSKLPLDEEIRIENSCLIRANGEVIAKLPASKE